MSRRKNRCDFFGDNFWQSDNINRRYFAKNRDMLVSLAINRFRWVNLPSTCDSRFLEFALLKNGFATICHQKDMPDLWQSLFAAPYGDFNAYGLPIQWRATGYGGQGTDFEVTNDNGVLVFNSFSRVNPWNMIELYARKLAHIERTEDVNLTNQMSPMLFIAPKEKRLELENLLKQTMGGEFAVLGDDSFGDIAKSVTAISTGVPFISEQLNQTYQNVLNQALMHLGVPHLAFEKGERMIEDEARANSSPTTIMLLNCLSARRQACDMLNDRFGLDVQVYYNDDYESLNWNYSHNLEAMAQDKIIEVSNTQDNVLKLNEGSDEPNMLGAGDNG